MAVLIVLVDGRVERDAIDPSLRGASALVVVKAVPKPDEDFLKQVVDFGLVAREHVAHRVDGPLVLPHQKFKLMFLVVVHNASFVATFIMLDNKGRELLQASRFFCTFAAGNNTLYNMITQDQLKDLCKRIDALRRYL